VRLLAFPACPDTKVIAVAYDLEKRYRNVIGFINLLHICNCHINDSMFLVIVVRPEEL
jgi:hypothetical protein